MKRIIKGFFIFLLIVVVAAGAAFAVNYYMNRNVYLTEYEYQNKKLPKSFDGFKIALISDIHNSPYADKFITLLDETDPDMVVFAGDMIQQPDTNLDNVLKIITSQAKKGIPVYAIFGNHEASNPTKVRNRLTKDLQNAGAKVLANTGDYIEKDGEQIRVIGIEDTSSVFVSDDIVEYIHRKVKKVASEDTLNILLYHRADVYPQINDLPVDLILSGHMHGGVVRLPFVGGIIGKGGEYFPEYTSGMYLEKKTAMVVSRGCDYNPQKIRIFNPPEIVTIALEKY